VKLVFCKMREDSQLWHSANSAAKQNVNRLMETTFKDTDIAGTIHYQKDFTNTPKLQLLVYSFKKSDIKRQTIK